jgi:hypothetical protein
MSFEKKDVFPYEVGGEKLFADPMVVYQRLMEYVQMMSPPCDLTILLERAYLPFMPMQIPILDEDDKPIAQDPPKPILAGSEDENPALKLLRADSRRKISDAMRHALELPAFNRKAQTEADAGPSEGSPTPSTPSPATGSLGPWNTGTQSVSG